MKNAISECVDSIAEPLDADEQRFRLLVEGIALATWQSDSQGGVTQDSPSWRAVTGQTPEQYVGSFWYQVVHAEDLPATREHWANCVRSAKTFNCEFRVRRADGGWLWTQGHASPLRDVRGSVVKWIGMIIDISDRKAAELKLQKRERQLQLALDISRTSFWRFDPNNNFVAMDERMRRMWGESSDDDYIPIDRVLDRIHPEDRPLVWNAVTSALDPANGGVYRPTDYRIVLDDGSIRWLAANGLTMFADTETDNPTIELVGTVLDITNRKLIEDSLRESEERLQQLNVQLEDRVAARTQELVNSEKRLRAAVELAEQSSRQLRRLAIELSRTEQRERRRLAQILHDHLQQLLVAAKMRVENLAHDVAEHETQERLAGISTVIDVAIDATRTLAVELVPHVLHSQGLPAALQWLAMHVQDQHHLIIRVNVDTAANPVSEESRDLLFQAAREFLLNIIKHASVKEAEVNLSVDGNRVLLEVKDRGVGFDPRLTANDAPTFGLFHLRERLAAVGGEISIESQPGSGTRVRVRIAR